jgi:hypothetical protein
MEQEWFLQNASNVKINATHNGRFNKAHAAHFFTMATKPLTALYEQYSGHARLSDQLE